ncbi:hypothetical protein ACWXWM_15165 [Pantoea dispersa]
MSIGAAAYFNKKYSVTLKANDRFALLLRLACEVDLKVVMKPLRHLIIGKEVKMIPRKEAVMMALSLAAAKRFSLVIFLKWWQQHGDRSVFIFLIGDDIFYLE